MTIDDIDPFKLACGCSFARDGETMPTMCETARQLRAALRQSKRANGPEMEAWLDHFKPKTETSK